MYGCLDIDDETRIIALVGGGGKTSLMYVLAREFSKAGGVITSTTTKIYPPTLEQSPCVMLLGENPANIVEKVKQFKHVTLADRVQPNGKLSGLDADYFMQLPTEIRRIVVEADGAAGHPVKAPESWEPVLPQRCDLVIPVIGLDCLGMSATKENVFRLDKFLRITGLSENDQITTSAVADLITHPEGCLYKVPRRSKIVPFLNKLDMLECEDPALEIIRRVKKADSPIRKIAYGSLKNKSGAIYIRCAEWR